MVRTLTLEPFAMYRGKVKWCQVYLFLSALFPLTVTSTASNHQLRLNATLLVLAHATLDLRVHTRVHNSAHRTHRNAHSDHFILCSAQWARVLHVLMNAVLSSSDKALQVLKSAALPPATANSATQNIERRPVSLIGDSTIYCDQRTSAPREDPST